MNFDLQRGVELLVPLILSLSVHEWAHAWSAWRLGDDTAARMGRLTLNPLAHIDPIGTIALPLLGVPFGWAKPVPVNPAQFRRDVNMNTGMMITAAAGPISNFVLALAVAVVLAVLVRFAPQFLFEQQGVLKLLRIMIGMNVTLGVFNLIPIPPLDGSRVVEGFLPYRFRDQWAAFARIAPIVLLALLVLPGGLVGRVIDGPRDVVLSWLQWIVNAIA